MMKIEMVLTIDSSAQIDQMSTYLDISFNYISSQEMI